jgi:hypothetical protein
MVTHGLALEYFLLRALTATRLTTTEINGPVAFRPMVTHGLAVKHNKSSVKVFYRQPGYPPVPEGIDGPVAFRPTVTRGLALGGGPAVRRITDPWLSVPWLPMVWL